MAEAFEALVEEAAGAGPRRYSRWDAAAFSLLAQGPARALWGALQAEPQGAQVFRAWLKLAAEAVGNGYLDLASVEHLSGRGPAPGSFNLLARALLHLVPEQLPKVPAGERLPLLARTWNLCEGLLEQPAWINRYVAAAASGPLSLDELDGFLVRTLEPVLAPARDAAFTGPFTLAVLDARPVEDEFLPGEMHFAAPAVLCVHDRRRDGLQLGVFLAPEGRSRLLGLNPCLVSGEEVGGGPPVGFKSIGPMLQVTTKGARTMVPFVHKSHRSVSGRAGFVVLSAVDSQRLWVLHSP